MTVYLGSADGRVPGFSVSGLFYGNPKQVGLQLGAAVTVIVWDAVMTVLILKVIGRFIALRLPDEVLESGDLGVHDEEAYPGEPAAGVTVARAVAPPPTAPAPPPAAPAPPDAPAAPPGVARAPADQGPP
jgi:Amt family ammonium transporter